jgi:membrane-bound lytic murein transglycosylase D
MEDMRFQTGQRDNVINGITIADRYFPWMEQIFRETGVPWELTRLGLVESSFNHRATSRVGAKGVYQFMEVTARKILPFDR